MDGGFEVSMTLLIGQIWIFFKLALIVEIFQILRVNIKFRTLRQLNFRIKNCAVQLRARISLTLSPMFTFTWRKENLYWIFHIWLFMFCFKSIRLKKVNKAGIIEIIWFYYCSHHLVIFNTQHFRHKIKWQST